MAGDEPPRLVGGGYRERDKPAKDRRQAPVVRDPSGRRYFYETAGGETAIQCGFARPARPRPGTGSAARRGIVTEFRSSVLEAAGLMSTARDAQRRPRRLEVAALAAADAWFEPFRRLWEGRDQALDGVLEEMDRAEPPRPQKRDKARRRPS